jgi:uncharacterized protein
MLIRLVIENLFSFGEQKEFTTIPNNRFRTLDEHKYNINSFSLLKLSAIYGANGAGKSNLVKSIELLQELVTKGRLPFKLKDASFKFNSKKNNRKQVLAVEFINNNTAFYYGIEILNNLVATEELYLSGLGIEPDQLIFERKTNQEKITQILFSKEFEKDEKSQLLKDILLEEFIKPNEPILKLLSNRENQFLKKTKEAFNWFDKKLQVITPISKPRALVKKLDSDKRFKKYAEDMMCSFNIGVTSLEADKKELKAFFGEDDEEQLENLIKEVEDSPENIIGLINQNGNEIIVEKENDKLWVKSLRIGHTGKKGKTALFDLDEESDGTIRLLDFVPAFQDIISQDRVFIIDEIERSIHPLLIKELVKKFSLDPNTKGQLIFTTHESNLLDQKILRQDEIWFAEKNENGSTDIYSLNDFKEHKTIDIQKGYLNGRYGSIPFLANLKDLNWHDYDTN